MSEPVGTPTVSSIIHRVDRREAQEEFDVTTSQYILNLGLLAYILWANLGSTAVTTRRFVLPLALVAVAGGVYLRNVPTAGHDITLEVLGLCSGLLLGTVAGTLVRVRRDSHGRLVTQAGAPYAVLWVVVIGGRIAFAYGASHWFPEAIGRFSATHQITGAPAWTAAFVLMALTMVLTRVLVTGIAVVRSSRTATVTA